MRMLFLILLFMQTSTVFAAELVFLTSFRDGLATVESYGSGKVLLVGARYGNAVHGLEKEWSLVSLGVFPAGNEFRQQIDEQYNVLLAALLTQSAVVPSAGEVITEPDCLTMQCPKLALTQFYGDQLLDIGELRLQTSRPAENLFHTHQVNAYVVGQGTVSPSSIFHSYPLYGLSMIATADEGWRFVEWKGPVLHTYEPQTSYDLIGKSNFYAVFEPIETEAHVPVGDAVPFLCGVALMILFIYRESAPRTKVT